MSFSTGKASGLSGRAAPRGKESGGVGRCGGGQSGWVPACVRETGSPQRPPTVHPDPCWAHSGPDRGPRGPGSHCPPWQPRGGGATKPPSQPQSRLLPSRVSPRASGGHTGMAGSQALQPELRLSGKVGGGGVGLWEGGEVATQPLTPWGGARPLPQIRGSSQLLLPRGAEPGLRPPWAAPQRAPAGRAWVVVRVPQVQPVLVGLKLKSTLRTSRVTEIDPLPASLLT